MRAIFEGIEDLFVNGLFWPYDFFRFIENWWTSNAVNWVFVISGAIAMFYWMRQLKSAHDKGEENKDITSHSYL